MQFSFDDYVQELQKLEPVSKCEPEIGARVEAARDYLRSAKSARRVHDMKKYRADIDSAIKVLQELRTW